MKYPLALALLLVPVLAAQPALAETYRWKDASGKTIISDTPPPRTADSRQVKSLPSDSAAEAGKSYQEKDKDFRKRLEGRRETEEKDKKEAAEQAALKEDCDRQRGALIALTSGQRLATLNSQGEQQALGDAEREREAARARDFIAKNCK